MVSNSADDKHLHTYLQDPLRAAAYLDSVLATGDRAAFLIALRHVVYARLGGMAQLAANAALDRKSLYRMLSERGSPRLKTLEKVLNAAGLRLAVTVQDPSEAQHNARMATDRAHGRDRHAAFSA
jgi:probable addiction module antidote protein